MAITYRSSSTATNAGATTLAITAPSGISDNDVMIAVICVNVETTAITAPSGWTLIRSLNTTFTARSSVYYKRASGESGSYTWTFDSSQRSTGAISVFVGVKNYSSPINVESGQMTTGGTGNAVSPTVTTTVPNTMLVWSGADDSSLSATWTPPSGMTESADSNSAQSCGMAYVIQSLPEATGTKTGVCTNTTDAKAAFIVALEPVVSGGFINFF